jgi:RecB family exonuclease
VATKPRAQLQQRTLIRARGLRTFRDALCALAVEGDVHAIRRRMVLVPTRASAELLRQGIERRLAIDGRRPATVLPDLVTRDEWLRRLLQVSGLDRRFLSRLEREVLLERSARHVATSRRVDSPFRWRSGLVSTVLDFYDELQRRERSIRRFARSIFDELRVERGTDRGSESLIDQTRFLGFTFLAYERGVAASGAIDEHSLRRYLLHNNQVEQPVDDLVIAVADHPADLTGLWPVDFDLAGRLTGLKQVRVVMTDESHDAGFRERIERQLPGIEERRWPEVVGDPMTVVPPGASASRVFISRDREEELRDVARTIRARAANDGPDTAGPVAVVFHRPLPYLYLSRQVLEDARVPFQAFDALPLAAEPYAALLDLVLTMARTGGTREASVDLVRSRLLAVEVDAVEVGRSDASTLEFILGERRATGDASTYTSEVAAYARSAGRRGESLEGARRAATALAELAGSLQPFRSEATASAQVRTLERFLRQYERRVDDADDSADRHRRARAAVLSVLMDLALAFERHDDDPRPPEQLAALIHHAIELRTFTPRHGRGGVHLVDRQAARFGEFDDTYLVGLVETDWSDRPRRNVLYSSGLLNALGWPQDTDQALAQQAAFADVLSLARCRTRLSAFQLEGDALVGLSPLVELARDAQTLEEPVPAPQPLFADELLTQSGAPSGLDAGRARWLEWRRARPVLTARSYGGFIGEQRSGVYRVSHVDRYVTCPFKYFAAHVLRLPEDRRVTAGLTPIERGTLLHLLFERFYAAWQGRGHGAVELHTLDEALNLFADITKSELATLPESDRLLEEMRILGSLVSRGVAERVFELELGGRVGVSQRLLEVELNGTFSFPSGALGLVRRDIDIKGKADRIDILDDGSLRVVDYKLGRMPDVKTSVQVGVYAYCAKQQLEAADGRPHPVSSAAYLAFGDDRRLEGRISGASEPADGATTVRAQMFAKQVEQIEAGEFPPRPLSTAECQWCGFSGVCRKEYRIDEDETADAI